jgi:type IV pilus assembly protein PilY1
VHDENYVAKFVAGLINGPSVAWNTKYFSLSMEFVMKTSIHNIAPPKDCAIRRKAFLPSGVFLFLALLSPLATKAQTPSASEPFNISQTPLITAAGGVAPNLLYLHDDSGSMVSAMTYNSNITYTPPFNADGSQFSDMGSNEKNYNEYYNTRQKAAQSAVSRAFINLPDSFRVGWGTIGRTELTGVRPFGESKAAFYEWLFKTKADEWTPLRIALDRAGRYYSKPGPWMDDVVSGQGSEGASCRKSFTILMTDGYWNDREEYHKEDGIENLAAIGDSDSAAFTTPQKPDGSTEPYSTAPFKGRGMGTGGENTEFQGNTTLADVAWYYWSRDLYGGNTDNKVSGTTRDPAWWQHMTTFTIGLTVSGNTVKKEDAFEAARTGAAISWPTVIANVENSPSKIDDLLHAAVNGHGDFFLANNIDEFVKSLTAMLSSIQSASGSNSRLAKIDAKGRNKNKIDDNTLAYEVRYNNMPNWHGQVLAYKLCSKTDVNIKTPGCAEVGDIKTTHEWDAGEKLGKVIPTERNILSWNTATKKGIDFEFTSLSPTQQGQLANPADNPLAPQLNKGNEKAILDYVRGDTLKETTTGSAPNPPFRARNDHLLGDTFSDPLYHGPSASKGYDTMSNLDEDDQKAYKTWKADAKYLSTRGMLYIGANDGMLHGFDALTGDEKVAYVPASVIPKLWKLADPDYTHEFYADATPIVEEAQFGDEWKNVLVGTAGAGGRSYFAIDVSNPSELNLDKVLWEFTDPDLGYSTGNASIARLKGGKWVAIFGNGYNSDNHIAQLFVVDLKTGALVKKLSTGVGDAAKPNGLSTPKAVDAASLESLAKGDDDQDGAVNLVYAGDIQGNLWRFDLSESDPDKWPAPSKLLEAKGPTDAPQPITAQPLVVRKRDSKARPSAAAGTGAGTGTGTGTGAGTGTGTGTGTGAGTGTGTGTGAGTGTGTGTGTGAETEAGIMVYVGTGKFFELDDLKDASVQSFYGVLDTGKLPSPPYSRKNKLVEQTIGTPSTIDIDGVTLEAATTSDNSVNYGAGERGFYIDLTAAKERVLTQAQYLSYSKSKGTVLIATLIPTGGSCSGGSEGFWMELEALSGKKPEKGTAMLFENQNRAKIGSNPATFQGGTWGTSKLGSPGGGMGNPCISSDGSGCEPPPNYCDFKARGGIGGAAPRSLKTCSSPGRKSWRQLR